MFSLNTADRGLKRRIVELRAGFVDRAVRIETELDIANNFFGKFELKKKISLR